jgi:hypothetical protein
MKFCKKDRLAQERRYANVDDFRQVFTTDKDRLYQLALLLAGNQEIAERIFASSLDDAVKSTGIFIDWARNWVKHTVIQNAIGIVHPQPRDDSDFYMPASPAVTGAPLDVQDRELALNRILELDDFERFVFVITVLEHYSDHDCALMLSAFFRDVRHSRVRAMQKIAAVDGSRSAFAERTPALPPQQQIFVP